jgi:hypothetical protein
VRILNVVQGSPEWIQARLGLPTASEFNRLLTKTGKVAAASEKYMHELVAEWFLGVPLSDYRSPSMERGSGMESEAVSFYEFENDCETTPVGLCLTDCGRAGASLDRLVGDDGAVEIKCPTAAVHVGYLLDGPPDEYRPQVQGQLWVTGRKWVDLLCFHPTLPSVKVRVERDEDYIADLEAVVFAFADRLAEAKERLAGDRAKHMQRKQEADADALASL